MIVSDTQRSCRVVVLLGGSSAEREISLQSGRAVADALLGRGHEVLRVDPAAEDLRHRDFSGVDAVFIALHGTFGEDGGVQQILDAAGVPYTGSDALASRLAFSKSAAKERFVACGVLTPEAALIHRSDSPRRIRALAEKVGYPLVVKPDASGSSLGVSIVAGESELGPAARSCFEHGPFGLVERAIIGSEWTLGVLDGDPLPLIRIAAQRPFYDFTAKYDDAATEYELDPPLPGEVLRSIEQAGLAACRAVGTSGIARVDLRVDAANRPWVLEVNTVPGFTGHSLVPKAAARRGWDLGELCERAVLSCLKSAPEGPQNAQNRGSRTNLAALRPAG